MIPVILILLNFGRQASTELISPNDIRAAFTPAKVLDIEIVQHDPIIVQATILSSNDVPREAVNIAQDMLTTDLGEPVQLQVIVHKIVEGHIEGD
jgi:hypothetical protein